MIKTKKELSEWLNYEYKKYFPKKINTFKYLFLRNINETFIIWRYQKKLRQCEYYINNNNKIKSRLYKYLLIRNGIKYGLNIPPNVFGKGLKIMHLGSILVNSNSKIGDNCSIHINVAIVAGGRTHDAPKVGNNCVIGVGTTILGGISIGDNCAIGAGAVVNKSFGDNVTIAGVPAKVISNNTSNDWGK